MNRKLILVLCSVCTISIVAFFVISHRHHEGNTFYISGCKIILPSVENIRFTKARLTKEPSKACALAIATFRDKSWFKIVAFKNSEIKNLVDKGSQAKHVNPYNHKFNANPTSLLDRDLIALSAAVVLIRVDALSRTQDGSLLPGFTPCDIDTQCVFSKRNISINGNESIIVYVFTEKPGFYLGSAPGLPNPRLVFACFYRPLSNGWTLAYQYCGDLEKWEKQKSNVERFARTTVIE